GLARVHRGGSGWQSIPCVLRLRDSRASQECLRWITGRGNEAKKEVTMRSILNEADRAESGNRLRSLSESSTRRWVSMGVAGMLKHLRMSAQMTLGERPVRGANKRAFQMFPLYVFPFPKGAPTAPELKPSDAATFAEERAALLELLERIGTGPREGAG